MKLKCTCGSPVLSRLTEYPLIVIWNPKLSKFFFFRILNSQFKRVLKNSVAEFSKKFPKYALFGEIFSEKKSWFFAKFVWDHQGLFIGLLILELAHAKLIYCTLQKCPQLSIGYNILQKCRHWWSQTHYLDQASWTSVVNAKYTAQAMGFLKSVQ